MKTQNFKNPRFFQESAPMLGSEKLAHYGTFPLKIKLPQTIQKKEDQNSADLMKEVFHLSEKNNRL
jgi:hypothetical protein